jgi:hypothetical protein
MQFHCGKNPPVYLNKYLYPLNDCSLRLNNLFCKLFKLKFPPYRAVNTAGYNKKNNAPKNKIGTSYDIIGNIHLLNPTIFGKKHVKHYRTIIYITQTITTVCAIQTRHLKNIFLILHKLFEKFLLSDKDKTQIFTTQFKKPLLKFLKRGMNIVYKKLSDTIKP